MKMSEYNKLVFKDEENISRWSKAIARQEREIKQLEGFIADYPQYEDLPEDKLWIVDAIISFRKNIDMFQRLIDAYLDYTYLPGEIIGYKEADL